MDEITPSEKEVKNQTKAIFELTRALTEKGESLGKKFTFIQAHGSTGQKQTQLRGASDIDLFVGLAPADYQNILNLPPAERFKAVDLLMESLIEQWFLPSLSNLEISRVVKSFSQHPYLNLRMRELDVDILGCFDLDSKRLMVCGPITAVDRTIHHTGYVVDNLTEKMREDVRILKSFVRACHAYGDKCAIGRMGFTGYSLELLIIACQSLERALNSLYNLDGVPIDPMNRSFEELRKIEAFRDDAIFIIDPTDHNRNVASSFSPKSYKWIKFRTDQLGKFVNAKMWNHVFEILKETPIPTNPIPKSVRKHMFVYEFLSDGSVHYTILRDKLHRLATKISRALENERTGEKRFGKSLTEIVFDEQHFSLGILVERPRISDLYIRRGPPTDLHEAVTQFTNEHPEAYEKDGYVWASEYRKWVTPDSLVKTIISQNSIDGLQLQEKLSLISQKVLNTIYRYILPVESAFPLSIRQGFKDNNKERIM